MSTPIDLIFEGIIHSLATIGILIFALTCAIVWAVCIIGVVSRYNGIGLYVAAHMIAVPLLFAIGSFLIKMNDMTIIEAYRMVMVPGVYRRIGFVIPFYLLTWVLVAALSRMVDVSMPEQPND